MKRIALIVAVASLVAVVVALFDSVREQQRWESKVQQENKHDPHALDKMTEAIIWPGSGPAVSRVASWR